MGFSARENGQAPFTGLEFFVVMWEFLPSFQLVSHMITQYLLGRFAKVTEIPTNRFARQEAGLKITYDQDLTEPT